MRRVLKNLPKKFHEVLKKLNLTTVLVINFATYNVFQNAGSP